LQAAQETLTAAQSQLETDTQTAVELHEAAVAAIEVAQQAVGNDSLVDLVQEEAHIEVGAAIENLLGSVDALAQNGGSELDINDILAPETVDLLANISSGTSEVTVAVSNPDAADASPDVEPDLAVVSEQLAQLQAMLMPTGGGNENG
jgi:hypothetical protein